MIRKINGSASKSSFTLREGDNSDMYYRLSRIDETDKLIKTLVRKWNAFKTIEPENFNAYVKNSSQEFSNLLYDAVQALSRAMNATTLGLSESINTEDPRKLWADKMGVSPKLLRTSSSGKGTVITISALNMFEIYGKGLTNKDIENAGNEVIKELGLDGKCYITDLGNYNGAKLKYN